MAQQMESKIRVVHTGRRGCQGLCSGMDWNDVDVANTVESRISICRTTQRAYDLLRGQLRRYCLVRFRGQAQLKKPRIQRDTSAQLGIRDPNVSGRAGRSGRPVGMSRERRASPSNCGRDRDQGRGFGATGTEYPSSSWNAAGMRANTCSRAVVPTGLLTARIGWRASASGVGRCDTCQQLDPERD